MKVIIPELRVLALTKGHVGSGNEIVKHRFDWHEQDIICSKTNLEDTTHEQTNIFRQVFASHVVAS